MNLRADAPPVVQSASSTEFLAAQVAALVEQSEDAVLSRTLDGRVVLWSRGAAKMYGYSAEEMLGRSVQILFPPGREAEFREIVHGLSQGKPASIPKTERLRKDGSRVCVAASIFPIRDAAGTVIGGSCIARDLSDQVRVKQELQSINGELRRLYGELLRSEDQERRRIARELHDGPVQEMAAIKLNLEALRARPGLAADAEGLRLLEESVKLANSGTRGLRTLSYLLHPPLLDELGLGTALESFVDGFSKRTGISVDLKFLRSANRLPPDVELALFRIVLESLANVHRHSGSAAVEIRTITAGGSLTMEVEDHGRGIGAAPPGVGIPGMKERARQLGGRLEIESRPGRTVVRVSLPLEERTS
jgi:PAS domain S-box-containing protein